jgi:hypothetical protein
MAQSGDSTEIDAAAARVLIGKALFGDDWIGPLSKKDLDLLAGPYGPQRKVLANGRTINFVPPCPANLRDKLNFAIGRGERAVLQDAMVIDIMHDNGFRDVARTFNRSLLHEFLKTIGRPLLESRKRSAGKPPDLIEGVIGRMVSDARRGIDIESMKGKELAAKYGVSRGTAVKARAEVLAKRSRK